MTSSPWFNVVNVAEANLATDGWEPFIVDGHPLGEFYSLHRELGVGLWRCLEDATYEYSFETDETYYVLQGEQRLKLDNGDIVVTGVGECASFQQGIRCSVELKAPFLEIFVVGGQNA